MVLLSKLKGNKKSMGNSQKNSQRRWSSAEDFERGDIVLDGVVLGQTTLQELMYDEQFEEFSVERNNDDNFVSFMNKDISGCIFDYSYKNIKKVTELPSAMAINEKILLNREKIVTGIGCKMNSRLFKNAHFVVKLGLDAVVVDWEAVNIIESHGYDRIEDPEDNDGISFVRKEKDTVGNRIFLNLSTDLKDLTFVINYFTQWTDYKTGKVHIDDYEEKPHLDLPQGTDSRRQLLDCLNPACTNYGIPNLPMDYRYCPYCGFPLFGDSRERD